MSTSNLDQNFAEINAGLDDLVVAVRESLLRKQERHGGKYDPAKALVHISSRISKNNKIGLTLLLGAALMRMAEVEPDFTGLAELDFDFDLGEGAGE